MDDAREDDGFPVQDLTGKKVEQTTAEHRETVRDAVKKDDGKFTEWALLTLAPPTATRAKLRVYGHGQRKYSTMGYLKSALAKPEEAKYSRLLNALFGHVFRWQAGEDLDPEFGESHLAHAICCLEILLEWHLRGVGTDDRNKLTAEELQTLGRLWR